MLWWMLTACGLLDLERGHDRHPETVHADRGVAVQIPVGATIRAEKGRLSVDAPDSSRWFDVAWVDADNPDLRRDAKVPSRGGCCLVRQQLETFT